MHVDIPVLISCLSLIVAVVVAAVNIVRNGRQDNKADAAEMTTLIVKLENISDGIKEIKGDMNSVKSDMQSMRDRVTVNEQRIDNARRRLEVLEKWKEERENA